MARKSLSLTSKLFSVTESLVVILGVPDNPQGVPPGEPDESVSVMTPGRNKIREVMPELNNLSARELLPQPVVVLEGVDPEGPVLELVHEVGNLQQLPQLADCYQPSPRSVGNVVGDEASDDGVAELLTMFRFPVIIKGFFKITFASV
jgi:hypothetical protein